MALAELIANSPTPGARVPLTTLAAGVVTAPVAGTQETWTFTAGPPAALAQAGQFRFVVDQEILLDITGGAGSARTVLRGQEGSTPAGHAAGSNVWHYLTAGALATLNGVNVPGYQIPPGWGANWLAKLRAADATHQAALALVGDSVGEGYDASNFETTSFFALTRAALQSASGKDGGSGFVSAGRATVADANITAWAAPSKVIPAGTWTASSGQGPGGFLLYSNTLNDTLTFTVRGTVVKVFYGTTLSSGSISITIDGGAPVNVNTNGANGLAVNTQSGLSNATHTVVIKNITGGVSGYSAIFGVSGEMAGGVLCHNFSHVGAVASLTNNQGAAPQYGYAGQWSGGSKLPADLVVYALGINDAAAATAVATWTYNLRTYLDDVRENNANADILLLMPHIGKWETGASKVWQDYIDRAAGIARSYSAALVDLWGLYRNSWAALNALSGWSNGHTATGAAGTDSVHPSNAGHQLYANALINLLSTGAL